ncbi:hypothetical protein [Amycolatopsis sp. lyj-112]|uniref:hypothetical protein n=1 Tax=Amycolatopsis sp. lyj-112 TaxID=2789288 RepID=UPI003978B010
MALSHLAVSGAAGAVLLASALSGGTPSAQEVSPHCQQDGYCLFSGTDFGGTKVSVPTGRGCKPVSALGIPAAGSAARGFGDANALELYADEACTVSAGTVFHEIPDTAAKAYRLIPIPG